METTYFNVNGLIDNKAANKLKNVVSSLSGVSDVNVNLFDSKVTVTYDPITTDISTIKNTIYSSGFKVQ
ncbi:MAG: heavy-metal-associated domain-containing protein [Deltaproteobacteria bacterium]